MASVVTFWQLPDEEVAFFRYLARNGEVVAIRHREAVPDRAALQAVSVKELIGRSDADRLYITLRSVAAGPLPLHRWEPERPGEVVRYSLPVEFPAIIYDVGTEAHGQLSQSNAAGDSSQSPAEVAAWMRRVFGWLRRTTPHWHEYDNYRATESAARAARGGLVLVPHHGWKGRSTGRSSFAPRPRRG